MSVLAIILTLKENTVKPNPKPKTAMNIRLDPDIFDLLAEVARKAGFSTSKMAQEIIGCYLEKGKENGHYPKNP